MLTCTAEGKQTCIPRVSALTALSPKTPVAARESAIQDHFLGLDQSAVAEDTAQNRMADHIDGPGAVAEGKKRKYKLDGAESDTLSQKRGSDECKDGEGPSDQRRKKEQAAKKPRKAPNLCELNSSPNV